MLKATYADKKLVVDILTASFIDNKSVNYIVKQDRKKRRRIERLMEYSFDTCYAWGEIFLSEDKKGCALTLLPEKKKTSLKSVWLDIKLITTCIGLAGIKKTLEREAKIKALQLKQPMYYLWFIGVDPLNQHKGTGTTLLREVIKKSEALNMSICLETSTVSNIPWYEANGFAIYNELDIGYKLFFLKRVSADS